MHKTTQHNINPLLQFGLDLMDHVASDRAPIDKVERSFAAWDSAMTAKESSEQSAQEYFIQEYENPQYNRENDYRQYNQDRKEVMEKWLRGTRGEQYNLIREFLRIPFPNSLEQGVMQQQVFTKDFVAINQSAD